jgi:hypothetical protein
MGTIGLVHNNLLIFYKFIKQNKFEPLIEILIFLGIDFILMQNALMLQMFLNPK